MFKTKKPVISFEIFPPKKDFSVETISNLIEPLKVMNPDYISVTYGAGGTSVGKTEEIVSIIKNKFNIESVAHLTCLTSTKEVINKFLDDIEKNNVHNVLTMRGDYPADPNFVMPGAPEYKYASDLVSFVKARGGFGIAAACYPEGHPQAESLESDMIHLKEKVDAGADFLITQLFYDNEVFYKFRDKAEKMGINVPIDVGIMPAINKNQIERIVSMCGSTIPYKLQRILDKFQNSPEALVEAGTVYAAEQIIDLLSSGVDGIHIYTMNQPKPTKIIMDHIAPIRESLLSQNLK